MSSDCNMPCSGKSGNRISLYKYSSTVSTTSTVSWTSLGRYTDSVNARTLNNGISFSSASLTIVSCQSACGTAGWTYAGVEYSVHVACFKSSLLTTVKQECWCSSALSSPGAKASSEDCNMAGTGASSQVCGGSSRVFIYQASSSTRRRRLYPNP
ncbi:hypothetical protein C8F01DRAFT_1164527 [Mycena amicta]|nr:hypothetical protein C8F01DRAFT_1164527 [Mycena amicta]